MSATFTFLKSSQYDADSRINMLQESAITMNTTDDVQHGRIKPQRESESERFGRNWQVRSPPLNPTVTSTANSTSVIIPTTVSFLHFRQCPNLIPPTLLTSWLAPKRPVWCCSPQGDLSPSSLRGDILSSRHILIFSHLQSRVSLDLLIPCRTRSPAAARLGKRFSGKELRFQEDLLKVLCENFGNIQRFLGPHWPSRPRPMHIFCQATQGSLESALQPDCRNPLIPFAIR